MYLPSYLQLLFSLQYFVFLLFTFYLYLLCISILGKNMLHVNEQEHIPVTSGFCLRQLGRTSPKNMENPSTNRLREEFKSMNWRFDRPTAVIIPKLKKKNNSTSLSFQTFIWGGGGSGQDKCSTRVKKILPQNTQRGTKTIRYQREYKRGHQAQGQAAMQREH